MDETFFIVLGLAAIVALLLGPIAFFSLRSARTELRYVIAKLARLEDRLAALETTGVPPKAAPLPGAAPIEPVAEARTVEAEKIEEPAPVLAPGPPIVPPVSPQPVFARPGLEERLGTRWAVWVGGAALAFGAILLVRYSIEQGVFGPGVRTICSALFAAALVAAGERLRRREGRTEPPSWREQPPVSAILTAAGTIAAFATVWAAHALYGFIGPAFALILLGATGLAAMLAAALHGPALAGLGLVAAFATPMLVESNEPSAWPVVLYVAVVAASAYGLARLRGWLWLALSGAAGGVAWGVMLAGAGGYAAAPSLLHLVVQIALALVFVAYLPNRQVADEEAWFDKLADLVVAAFAALSVVVFGAALMASQFGTLWQVCLAATVACFIACGVQAAPAIGALVGGAFVTLAALWIWPAEAAPPLVVSGQEIFTDWRQPRDPTLYAILALLLAMGSAVASAWRVTVGPNLRLPLVGVAIGVANLLPLCVLGIAFLRFTQGDASALMAMVAAVLALVFVGAANLFRIHPRLLESRAIQLAFGSFAAGAIAALALGLVFILQGGTLTVALGLAALGTAFVAHRLDVPALRWCVAAFGLLVAARFAWDPRIVGSALGTTPIFNWLLFGYGVPAVCFALASRLMRREADDIPVRVADGCAVLFVGLLVFFEIRHGINGGDAFAMRSSLVEHGLMALSAFCFSIVLLTLDARRANRVFRVASTIAGVLGLGTAAVNLLVFANPFFTGRSIEGGALVNGLILGYALPGLAAFVLARRARAYGRRVLASAAGIATIGFIFLYVSLETRRLFHEADVGFMRSTADAEFYAYSAVWLVLGILLLGYGLWRGSKEARIASAFFVVLTVLKVFFLDLAGLEGILRAVSFIGLGLVLIGIGLVYQKIVFARPQSAPPAPSPMPETGSS